LVWIRVGAGDWVKVRVWGLEFGLWLTLTSDLDPLSQESYGHDPYVQKVKVKGHLVQKLRVETDGHTDGWMEATALPPMLMQSVNI